MPLLEIRGLSKRFGGVVALNDVSLDVAPGEIVGLIGPNGSGKTTLFNCVTGFYRPDKGRVLYDGQDITHQPPHKIALSGLARTFQIVQIFPGLTVFENLLLALQEHQERNAIARFLRFPSVRRGEAYARERAIRILREFNLLEKGQDLAGTLSYGQRKLLEFAAVLMPDPKLILLDEPVAAINPTMIENMKAHIRRCNREGTAFLIIEHNMSVVMDICARVVVLDFGMKIAEGPPDQIQRDPVVLEAYFGR
jgi:ABC-type branched-subunit amino acid transport system ATPase component